MHILLKENTPSMNFPYMFCLLFFLVAIVSPCLIRVFLGTFSPQFSSLSS